MEIGIEAKTAVLFIFEVFFGGFKNFPHLVVGGDGAHDGEHLSGQRHAQAFGKVTLDAPAVIVVVAVKKSVAGMSLDPFFLADVVDDKIVLSSQICRQLWNRHFRFASRDHRLHGIEVFGQNFLFGSLNLRKLLMSLMIICFWLDTVLG